MRRTTRYVNSGLLVWHVARSLCTIDPNLALRLGLSVESGRHECRADTFVARIHPDDRARVLEEGRVSFATGAPFSTRYRIYDRSNEIVTVHASGWWMYDEANLPSSMLTHLVLRSGEEHDDAEPFAEAAALIHRLYRLSIDQGWRDLQYLSDVLDVQLRTMLNRSLH